MIPVPRCVREATLWNAVERLRHPWLPADRCRTCPSEDPALPGDYVFIRFFGNFTSDDGTPAFSDNLAVLLRARDLREITKRTDWDTPGGWRVDRHPRLLADLTGDGQRRHRRLRRRRRVDRAEQDAAARSPTRSSCWPTSASSQGWRVDKHPRLLADLTGDGKADIVGFGDAGVYDGAQQRRRHVPAAAVRARRLRLRARAGGSTSTRASSPTSPVTAGPTSSASATPACRSALSNGDGTFQPHAVRARRLRLRPGLAGRQAPAASWPTSPATAAPTSSASAMPACATALSNGDGTFQPRAVRARRLRLRPGLAGGQAPALPGRPHRRRPGRHRRLRRRRRVYVALSNGDGTFQSRRSSCSATSASSRRLAGREAPAVPGRPHRRRQGRHRRLRRRRRVHGAAATATERSRSHPVLVLPDFGFDQGWRVDHHPRFLADVTGEEPGRHRRLRRRRRAGRA